MSFKRLPNSVRFFVILFVLSAGSFLAMAYSGRVFSFAAQDAPPLAKQSAETNSPAGEKTNPGTEKTGKIKFTSLENDALPFGAADDKLIFSVSYPETNINANSVILSKDPVLASSATELSGVRDLDPAWSPDGSKIVFVSRRGSTAGIGYPQRDREIYLMNKDGSGQQRLTANFFSEADPSFSPDGTKVIYVGETGDSVFGIYSQDIEGPNQTPTLLIDENSECFSYWRLKENRSRKKKPSRESADRMFYPGYLEFETPNFRPNAAPGSEKIVFGYDGVVYTMNPDGSGCSVFYDDTQNFAAEPRYSPDGTKIALVDFYYFNNIYYYYLKILDADTGALIDTLTPVDFNSNPVWSPDGTKIAFYAGENLDYDGGLRIEMIGVDGSNQTQVFTPDGIPRFSGLSWGVSSQVTPPLTLRINSPHPVPGGDSTTGVVTIDTPAPVGGVTVNLFCSCAVGAITIPPSVTIEEGQTQGSFPISTAVLISSSATTQNITAQRGSNLAQASVTILPSRADLQAVSFTAPDTITPGQLFNVSWAVENIGPVATAGGYTDQIVFSTDEILDDNDYGFGATNQSVLAAGAPPRVTTKDVSLPGTAIPQAGNYYLIFVTNRNELQNENGKTANNTIVRPVQIILPDLVAENIVAPPEIEPRVNYTVEWTVRNAGTSATPVGFNNYLYFSLDAIAGNADDLFIAQRSTAALAAGDSVVQNATVNIPTTPVRPSGQAFFYVKADGGGVVTEGSPNSPGETNNTVFKQVDFFYRVPDLQVTAVNAPPEVETDTEFSIGWTTTNTGNKDATAFTERVYYSPDNIINGNDVLLGTFPLAGGLAAGQSVNRVQNVTIPTGSIQTGDYFLYVRTDTASNVDEGENENNNAYFQPTRVRRFIRPDLTVTNVTAPPTAFFDQTVQVQWTVTNSGQGATNTPQWKDTLYIGTSANSTAGAIKLADAVSITALNPGESYTASATVKIPRGITGAYYFHVRTNSNGAVNEDSTTNNLRSSAVLINMPPLPDLIVENVQVPSATAFAGQELPVSYTIKNQGTATAGSWRDRVYLSRDTTLDTSEDRLIFSTDGYGTGDLGPNETVNLSTRNRIPRTANPVQFSTMRLPSDVEGLWYVFVLTDYTNTVYEFNDEFNNSNYDSVQPGSPLEILVTPPDLVVLDPPTAPDTAAGGQTIQVDFTVKNQGAFAAAPNLYHAVYLSDDQTFDPATDTLLGTVRDADSFPAGSEHPLSVNIRLPDCIADGQYYLFAVADYDQRQHEFDPGYDAEANNASPPKEIQLSTLPPDLVVTDVQYSPVTAPGQTIQIQYSVSNTGVGAATGNWVDRIVLNSANPEIRPQQLALIDRTGDLAAGGTYTQTVNVALPVYMEGEYFITVITDYRDSVPECGASENNNVTASSPFTVQNNLPDLVIDAVNIPPTAVIGEDFSVTWTGRNANGAMLSGVPKWNDSIYLSTDQTLSNGDHLLGSRLNEIALSSGQAYQQQAQVRAGNIPPGNYYVLVVADSGRHIYEGASNTPPEQNNVLASTPVTLTAPAVDLQVESVSVAPPFYSGTNISVSWTVRNFGTNPTLGTRWSDYVILSRDSILDASDYVLGYRTRTEALNGGESYTVTGSFFVPNGLTGDYNIFVVTDRSNYIIESDNNNNASQPFAVNLELTPPADLNVTNVSPPATVSPGQSATFGWTVQNSGPNAVLGRWRDTVYLSRDSFWDASDVLVGYRDFDSQITPVPAGGTYSGGSVFAVPPVEEGTYYVIVRTDAQNHIRENNEANNISAANAVTTVTITELQLGTPLQTTLGNGEQKFYKIAPPPLETMIVSLMTDRPPRANELLTNFDSIVSRADYDFQGSRPGEGNQENLIPETGEGNYYSMVRTDFIPESFAGIFDKTPDKAVSNRNNGIDLPVPPQNIEVEARILPFSIREVSPREAGNEGFATLIVEGAKFQQGASIKLVADDGTELVPIQHRVSTFKIAAIFDLKGKAVGDYDVVVTNADKAVTTLEDGFRIVQGGGHSLRESVTGPRAVYTAIPSRQRFTVSAINDGLNDALNVPLVIEIPKFNYELDRRNIIEPPPTAVVPDVPTPLPMHYDIGDRRVILLIIPILRSKTTLDFGIDVLYPGGGGYMINAAVLPPLAEVFAAGFEPTAEDLARQMIAPSDSSSNACWAEFARALAFFVIKELFGHLSKADECVKALVGMALNAADVISGVVLGAMTGTGPDYAGTAMAAAGKVLDLVATAKTAAALVDCAGTVANTIPWYRVASVALSIAQLLKQLYECLQPLGINYAIAGLSSFDPNEKIGPEGYGPEHFVAVRQPMLYRINFENLSTASAPARRIFITDELPPTLDARTVRLREIGFKQYRVLVEDNSAFHQSRIQLGDDLDNLQADISAGLDIVNRRIFWTITAIDPETGEQPADPAIGILPPNNENGDGTGYVTFTVEPDAAAPTRTLIENWATIVFDENEPIITNTTANLLDSGVPTSSVSPLPATGSSPVFELNWTGGDDAEGSGLKGFDVLYSENGGLYVPFVVNSQATSLTFTGKWGKTYRFYSVARDNAGNIELPPPTPDAVITVLGGDTEADVAPRPNGNDGQVTVGDVTQIRRFAAGLDTDFQFNEFQRADNAPLGSGGDGVLSTADVVQARRFAAGLDPTAEAAGPNQAAPFGAKSSLINVSTNGKRSEVGAAREIRPVRVQRNGNQVVIAVELEAQGDEVGVGFTLNFDPAVLSNPTNIALGSGAAGATLTFNDQQAGAGRLGIILDKAPNDPFPAGARQLVTITFDVSPTNPSSALLSFGNAPVVQEVVNGTANPLPTVFTPATVSLVPVTAASAMVSGRVTTDVGRALARVSVRITGPDGTVKAVTTNQFGNFRFEEVEVGQVYAVTAVHKEYSFSPQVVTVNEDVSDLTLIGSPR